MLICNGSGIKNAFKIVKEKSTMNNETSHTDTREQLDDFSASTAAERQRISRIADEAARRGRDRQQGYDEEHNIFTE
jgi:hypothetical protein